MVVSLSKEIKREDQEFGPGEQRTITRDYLGRFPLMREERVVAVIQETAKTIRKELRVENTITKQLNHIIFTK